MPHEGAASRQGRCAGHGPPLTATSAIGKDTAEMTDNQRVWMTRKAYTRLQIELAGLRSGRRIEVPDDLMDCDENQIARYRAREARIRQIHELMTNAIVD